MSFYGIVDVPDSGPGGHRAGLGQQVTAGRLRFRLFVVIAAATVTTPLFTLVLGRHLGASVAGPLTLGMLLLGVHVLAMLVAAVWYDRACSTHFDSIALPQHSSADDPETGRYS